MDPINGRQPKTRRRSSYISKHPIVHKAVPPDETTQIRIRRARCRTKDPLVLNHILPRPTSTTTSSSRPSDITGKSTRITEPSQRDPRKRIVRLQEPSFGDSYRIKRCFRNHIRKSAAFFCGALLSVLFFRHMNDTDQPARCWMPRSSLGQ